MCKKLTLDIEEDISNCWGHLYEMSEVLSSCSRYLTTEEISDYETSIFELASFPEMISSIDQAVLYDVRDRIMGIFYPGALLFFELKDYNRAFIEKEKKRQFNLFQKNGNAFDQDQKDAVIVDENVNLLIAPAGSGKTKNSLPPR